MIAQKGNFNDIQIASIFLVMTTKSYYLSFENEVKLSNMALFKTSGKAYSNTACNKKFPGELILNHLSMFSYILRNLVFVISIFHSFVRYFQDHWKRKALPYYSIKLTLFFYKHRVN